MTSCGKLRVKSTLEIDIDSIGFIFLFIRTGGIMGLRPTQGDEKPLPSSNHSLWNRYLFFVIPSEAEGSAVPRTSPGNVFSTEESWAFGPPKVMKNPFGPATTLYGTVTLSFVIPTEANPDFLPRSARQSRVCAFLLRKGA
jgi:hypothetical protein